MWDLFYFRSFSNNLFTLINVLLKKITFILIFWRIFSVIFKKISLIFNVFNLKIHENVKLCKKIEYFKFFNF